jgi:hypothetical protein
VRDIYRGHLDQKVVGTGQSPNGQYLRSIEHLLLEGPYRQGGLGAQPHADHCSQGPTEPSGIHIGVPARNDPSVTQGANAFKASRLGDPHRFGEILVGQAGVPLQEPNKRQVDRVEAPLLIVHEARLRGQTGAGAPYAYPPESMGQWVPSPGSTT